METSISNHSAMGILRQMGVEIEPGDHRPPSEILAFLSQLAAQHSLSRQPLETEV